MSNILHFPPMITFWCLMWPTLPGNASMIFLGCDNVFSVHECRGSRAINFPGIILTAHKKTSESVLAYETCRSHYLGDPFQGRECHGYCCGHPTYQYCCQDCFQSLYALSCIGGDKTYSTMLSSVGGIILMAVVLFVCWVAVRICRRHDNGSTTRVTHSTFPLGRITGQARAADRDTPWPVSSHDTLETGSETLCPIIKASGGPNQYPVLPPAYEDIPKTAFAPGPRVDRILSGARLEEGPSSSNLRVRQEEFSSTPVSSSEDLPARGLVLDHCLPATWQGLEDIPSTSDDPPPPYPGTSS